MTNIEVGDTVYITRRKNILQSPYRIIQGVCTKGGDRHIRADITGPRHLKVGLEVFSDWTEACKRAENILEKRVISLEEMQKKLIDAKSYISDLDFPEGEKNVQFSSFS